MRKRYPPNKARRVRRAFLLLPKQIGGETRWLEWACWLDEYSANIWPTGVWFARRWVSESDYESWLVKDQWYLVLHTGFKDEKLMTRDEYIASFSD